MCNLPLRFGQFDFGLAIKKGPICMTEITWAS